MGVRVPHGRTDPSSRWPPAWWRPEATASRAGIEPQTRYREDNELTRAWQSSIAIVVNALPWSETAIAQETAGELPDILAEAVAARVGVTDTVVAQGLEWLKWLDRLGERE